MKTSIYEQEQPDGSIVEFVIIDRGNGEFTSMTKEHYDLLAAQAVTNDPR